MVIKVGDVFISNKGHTATVVKYINNKKVTIVYPSGHKETMQGINLTKGTFRDRDLPILYGVGIIGYGGNCDTSHADYRTWGNMLKRVYNPKVGTEAEAYKDSSVCDEWLRFNNFKKWFHEQKHEIGFNLDKDLLHRGNKIYAPDNCIFLPQEINKFLTNRKNHRGEWPVGVCWNKSHDCWDAKLSIESKSVYLGLFQSPDEAFIVYKNAKENEAKRLAYKWVDKIDERAFKALSCFEVHLND